MEARGNPLVGLVEGGPRDPPETVCARRVAERFGQEREHRVERLTTQRRRSGVVEVDRHGSRLYAAVLRRQPATTRGGRHSPLEPQIGCDTPGMAEFTIEPRGRFSLAASQQFLGGFTPAGGTFASDDTRLTMAFPVDGWSGSAAAMVWQDGELIRGEAVVSSPDVTIDAVRDQVARTLSLDHDGTGWEEVGLRDPVIGRMQAEFDHLRPVCFYSPYEAAVQAVIGQRISMRQAATIKTALAKEHGELLAIGGQRLNAFALPQNLTDVNDAHGLSDEKLRRLHEVARAALEGRLETEHLLALPYEKALASLREIRGIGEWSAGHILLRGAGLADAVPLSDPRTRTAIRAAYDLKAQPDEAALMTIAEAWRPFRMWGFVLVRLWHSRTSPASLRQKGR